MPDKDKHSYIGASSAHRWMNCPGSVRLLQLVTDRKSTEYADLGTAAHELCEMCLRSGAHPSLYEGTVIDVHGRSIVVDDAMIESVSVYYNEVTRDLAAFGGKLNVEESFSLSWLYPGMFGRNDSSIVPEKLCGTLYVYDYKHGKKAVPAADNPQLKYYALGALGPDNPMMVTKVVCKIIQPNCWGKDPVETWETTADELYAWGRDVLKVAAARTAEPDAPCVPGSWCHFCEAEGMCPAKAQQALELLDAAPLETLDAPIALPAADLLTPAQLGMLCNSFLSDEFAAWLKAIGDAETSLLNRGIDVPGRKLVEHTSQGNRKWADDEEARKHFVQQYGEDALEAKLKSPAQMEKLLTSLGIPKKERAEMLEGFVTRPISTTFKVVPDGDPRPRVIDSRDNDINLFD